MKKPILISIIIILSALLLMSSLMAVKYKQQYETSKVEIEMLNTTISKINSENRELLNDNDFAQKQYEDLKSTKSLKELIDIEIQECMKVCNYTTACMNNCVYASEDKWEKEIDKNIKSLEKIMTKEQMTFLHNSQEKWTKYRDAQRVLNAKTIGTMQGTIYTNILSSEQVNITELRAKELKALYSIFSEQ